MLDLNFVRDHLPQVEEKLRQRGTNAAEVLKDFAAIDAERRQAPAVDLRMNADRRAMRRAYRNSARFRPLS